MSAVTLSSLLPGLADGYERRRRLSRARGISTRKCGELFLPVMWEHLSRRYGAEEAVAIMAEGGWRGWAAEQAEEVSP